jgi:hypothetical protein
MSRPLRILVVWRDPVKDPFLARMTVRVRQDGASGPELARATDSKPGRLTFDVPDTVRHIRLEVVVPSPDPIHVPTDVVNFWQEADVVDVSLPRGPVRGLNATKSSRSNSPFHPRIKLTEPWSPGASGVAVLELDVRFLDVSSYAASLAHRGFGPIATGSYQCKWSIFAHTQAMPLMWAVGVSPHVAQNELNANVLLFFQHELFHRVTPLGDLQWKVGYSGPEDLDYQRLGVYIDPPGWSLGNYINPRGSAGHGFLRNYPRFGWDKQLAESGKPIVFVFPFPGGGMKGTDFGVVNFPNDAASILASLLRALQAENLVASQVVFPARLQRLAIAGWSSGVVAALNWLFGDARGIVDEAYLFDGLTPAANLLDADPTSSKMSSWFKKKARKLRLMGTAYTEVQYNRIAKAIGSADATAHPNKTDYWYTDPFYKRALTLEGDPEVSFDRLGSPATTKATLASNVFLISENVSTSGDTTTATLELGSPGLRSWKSNRTVGPIGHTEAASIIAYLLPGFVSGQNSFDDITSKLQPSDDPDAEPSRILKLRHPWSCFGGTGPPFKGYLQMCLEKSGF